MKNQFILGIIVSIGGIAITKTINNTKEKNYNTLVANIKNAVELYYQECNYGDTSIGCDNPVKASTLINNGYIKPNKTIDIDPDEKNIKNIGILINPKTDGDDLSKIEKICEIQYSYNNYNISINIISKNGAKYGIKYNSANRTYSNLC